MPKYTALILFALTLSFNGWGKELRKPRWPLPKADRSPNSSGMVRISEYKNYVKSLSDSELKEFAEDARISFGSLGVNPERILVKFKDAETEQLVLQALPFKKTDQRIQKYRY